MHRWNDPYESRESLGMWEVSEIPQFPHQGACDPGTYSWHRLEPRVVLFKLRGRGDESSDGFIKLGHGLLVLRQHPFPNRLGLFGFAGGPVPGPQHDRPLHERGSLPCEGPKLDIGG